MKFRDGKCRQKTKGECNVGIRYRSYIVLTGSVMSLWPKVESVLSEFGAKMQVCLMMPLTNLIVN